MLKTGLCKLFPGSHLRPFTHERSSQTDALFDLEDQVEISRAEIIELPAGGVMFHHCQTLHYTPPNHTDRQRRAFAIHFMIPGTKTPQNRGIHARLIQPSHVADAHLINAYFVGAG